MAFGKSQGKGAASALIIKSIGACVALPEEKKKVPCVVVAYATQTAGSEVRFLALPLPAKGKYLRPEEIIEEIAEAEGVNGAQYLDDESRPLDIYFCRPAEGKTFDVAERDEEKNCFVGGFAEVTAGKLRFCADLSGVVWKLRERMNIPVAVRRDDSARDSYGYAVANAYNACRLGKVFCRDELYLETRDKRRVKIEARSVTSRYVEEDILYLRPVFREGDDCIDHYLTEEFNYQDGVSLSRRVYQVKYSERLGDYNVTRV